MNKKQRKRKEKQARAEKAAQSQAIPVVAQHIGEEHLETKEADKGAPETRKRKPRMSLIEWMDHNAAAPNWIIAVFTVVLSVFAIFQAVLMDRQLGTMRVDQRPWVRIVLNTLPDPIHENGTTIGSASLINSGKTPAKNVFLDIVVQKLTTTEDPVFSYPKDHANGLFEVLYPNLPTATDESVPYGIQKPTGTAIPVYEPFTKQDVDAFNAGQIYFVVYGKVSYTDFFHTKHWTQVCSWMLTNHPTLPIVGLEFNARKCTQYNDVDDN